MALTRSRLSYGAVLLLGAAVALGGCGAQDDAGAHTDIVLAGAATAREATGAPTGATPTAPRSTPADPYSSAAAVASSAADTVGPVVAQPAPPSQAPTSSAPAPGPTSAATCTVPTPGGALALSLPATGLTCAQATQVVTAYLATADDGTHGNTKALTVSGWACQTPTATLGLQTGVRLECAKDGQLLVAR